MRQINNPNYLSALEVLLEKHFDAKQQKKAFQS